MVRDRGIRFAGPRLSRACTEVPTQAQAQAPQAQTLKGTRFVRHLVSILVDEYVGEDCPKTVRRTAGDSSTTNYDTLTYSTG